MLKNSKNRIALLVLTFVIAFVGANVWGAAVEPQSAIKAQFETKNCCRQIIEALNCGNIGEAQNLLRSFYRQIPSKLTMSTRGHGSMSPRDFEFAKKQDAFDFRVSLFLCLARCLECSVMDGDASKILLDSNKIRIIHKDENSFNAKILLYIKGSNPEDHSIAKSLITFSFTEAETKLKLAISVEALSPDAEGNRFIDISNGYKTGNFFKTTVLKLVPCLSDLKVLPIDFGEGDKDSVVETYTPAETDLSKRIFSIFQSIHKNYRVNLEVYSQLILYGIIKFMGSCFCMPEPYVGEGRADLIIHTQRGEILDGCIIELKREGTAAVAFTQIDTKKYADFFDNPVHRIGLCIHITPSRKTITVSCKIRLPEPMQMTDEQSSFTYYAEEHVADTPVTSDLAVPEVVAALVQDQSDGNALAGKKRKPEHLSKDEPAAKKPKKQNKDKQPAPAPKNP